MPRLKMRKSEKGCALLNLKEKRKPIDLSADCRKGNDPSLTEQRDFTSDF
ncbi:hypothetical protein D1BOALGB6SA_1142 [Olavius sp. associated proteobacterium Delta 1]|nr:hypothetical protein D1BOALGB6SA_1142 [Olavius sp. associated proteobacterium Delta 1]